ncbi:hypothetical protein THAOC_29091, partial [Thalassiosira oceanica]
PLRGRTSVAPPRAGNGERAVAPLAATAASGGRVAARPPGSLCGTIRGGPGRAAGRPERVGGPVLSPTGSSAAAEGGTIRPPPSGLVPRRQEGEREGETTDRRGGGGGRTTRVPGRRPSPSRVSSVIMLSCSSPRTLLPPPQHASCARLLVFREPPRLPREAPRRAASVLETPPQLACLVSFETPLRHLTPPQRAACLFFATAPGGSSVGLRDTPWTLCRRRDCRCRDE